MKIKVVILDQDQNYQNRLLVALRERFSDFIEVIPCNGVGEAEKVMEFYSPDLFVVNERVNLNYDIIGEECAIACFTEFQVEKAGNGKTAICKYQKLENLCRQFITVATDYFVELSDKKIKEKEEEEKRLEQQKLQEVERLELEKKAEEERIERERREEEERLEREKKEKEEEEKRLEEEKIRLEEEKKAEEEKLISRRSDPDIEVIFSALPEDGSSTASIAFAQNAAIHKLSVLFINLKPFKNLDQYFPVDLSKTSFADIISKANLGELSGQDIQDAVVQNNNGIYYISQKYDPFTTASLEKNGIDCILKAARECTMFDRIVINIDVCLNAMTISAMNSAKNIICVGTGYPESNNKITAFYDAMRENDSDLENKNTEKLSLLYNKFVNRKCVALSLPGVVVLGGVNLYNNSKINQVMENMTRIMAFDKMNSID